MAFSIDLRAVETQLEQLAPATRIAIRLSLEEVARFAGLSPPPSPVFLLLEGIDPTTVFRVEVHGLRVGYEFDLDASVLRVTRIGKVARLRTG